MFPPLCVYVMGWRRTGPASMTRLRARATSSSILGMTEKRLDWESDRVRLAGRIVTVSPPAARAQTTIGRAPSRRSHMHMRLSVHTARWH
jgi:hypothetical protein